MILLLPGLIWSLSKSWPHHVPSGKVIVWSNSLHSETRVFAKWSPCSSGISTWTHPLWILLEAENDKTWSVSSRLSTSSSRWIQWTQSNMGCSPSSPTKSYKNDSHEISYGILRLSLTQLTGPFCPLRPCLFPQSMWNTVKFCCISSRRTRVFPHNSQFWISNV